MLYIKNVTDKKLNNNYLDPYNSDDYCSPDNSCGPDFESCNPDDN